MSNLSSASHAIVQSLGLSNEAIYSVGVELINDVKARGAILDFGSGQGRFLSMIEPLNFENIAGADLMERPIHLQEKIKWIHGDLNKPLPVESEKFDIVIAIEVIEHLENPRAMIRELYRLLKPGGYLILSTPNNESLRAMISLIFRGHFVSFLERDYPAHITALVRLDLKRILSENNFKEIKFKYVPRGSIPFFGKKTWQQLSLGYLKGKRFSDNIFVRAQK